MAKTLRSEFSHEFLQVELAKLKPIQALCFACSCSTRLLPVVKLWSDEVFHVMEKTVLEVWDKLEQGVLPDPKANADELLAVVYEKLTLNRDLTNRLVMFIADSAIPAFMCLQGYIKEWRIVDAICCGTRVYETSHTLAHELIGFDPTQRDTEATIVFSSIVQEELDKQSRDLALISSAVWAKDFIQHLREESYQMGQRCAEQVQQHLNQQVANWEEAKATHVIGSQVEGFVEYYHPNGIVLKLDEASFGVARYSEPEIAPVHGVLRVRRDKIQGIVTEYDEINRFVVLKSPQVFMNAVS